jgi:protein-disulfide isomerase
VPKRLSRREWLQLAGVLAAGWGAARLFQHAAPLGRDVSTNLTAQRLLHDQTSPRLEAADADLTMIVFTDYQCPACKVAAPHMDAAIKRDGRIRVIYKDWPIFGPRSERAARIALASVPQGIYTALHSRLMAQRRQLDDDILRADVEATGGNWPQLLAHLAASKTAINQSLARTSNEAFALSLPGTPAYIIGNILIVGGLNESTFPRAFAEARSQRR